MPIKTESDITGTGGGTPAGGRQLAVGTHYQNIVQGTWTSNQGSGHMLGIYLQTTTTAINDEVEYAFDLPAGTYDIILLVQSGSSFGKAHIIIDDVDVGNLDTYDSPGGANVKLTLSGIVITSTGVQTVGVSADSKNGSSSDYTLLIQAIEFVRTA